MLSLLFVLTTFILLILTNLSLVGSQNCSNGWNQFENKCFMFFADRSYLTFYEAHIVCKDFYNATLVSIHSEDEQQFLSRMAFQMNRANNHVWIGARRVSNETFEWEDGSPFNYTNWAKTQPNNLEGKHFCASLLQSTNLAELGTWYDDPCSDKYNLICQRYVRSNAQFVPNARTSSLNTFDRKNLFNKTLIANSSSRVALIAATYKDNQLNNMSNSSANSALISIVIIQFLIIVCLIFFLVKKSSMFPSYRTLIMSECSANPV